MIRKIKVKDIRSNPFQARKSMDAEAIKSLAEEIRQTGLWTGSLRGREKNGVLELCFGHRRLEAVKLLGLKEIEIEVVKLSDEQMAMQGLIENLQREGLNDVERAEGILNYIKLKTGISDLSPIFGSKSHKNLEVSSDTSKLTAAKNEIAEMLGIGSHRITELLHIGHLDEQSKEPIRQQRIAGGAVLLAEKLGGKEGVKVAAEKGLGKNALGDIAKQVNALPDEKVKEKVKAKFAKGEITTPEDVVTAARRIKAASTRQESVPPDLIDVMREWTERAHRWAGQLDQIESYIDYMDKEPKVAERWRAAVKELIGKLQKFV